MSEARFQPRQPAYLDIDLTGDGHGHHIPGTPDVYKHGWRLLKGNRGHGKGNPPQTTAARATRSVSLVDKKGKFTGGDATTIRHFRKITEDKRMELFSEAGLHLKYHDKSVEELDQMWTSTSTPVGEKAAIREEIETRMRQLEVYAKSWDQSLTDSLRENRRDALRRWDDKLRRLPGGKHVIDLRERLLKDKVLDKTEGLKEWFNEYGKHYAKHVATAIAIGMLLHPIGLAAGGLVGGAMMHGAGGEVGRKVAEHLLENIFVHSGLAVALVKPVEKVVGPFFKPLEKEQKVKKAKKVLLKEKV